MAGEILWEHVQLIIGAIVVVLVIFIVNKPLSAAEGSHMGTSASLGTLVSVLDEYDRAPAAMQGVRFIPDFFVEDGFYLVAFDADQQIVRDACAETDIQRPQECSLGQACICLCYEGKPCKDNFPECRKFDQIKRIAVTDLVDDNFIGEKKAADSDKTHLVIYGDCGVGSSTLRPVSLHFSMGAAVDREILISSKRPS